MKRLYTTLLCAMALASFMLTPAKATAQNDDEPASIVDSISMLDKRINKLEGILSKLPKISGYIQTMYTWSEDESTFQIRRARITLKGDIYKSYADYALQADFANSVKLIDAYVRLTPWRQLNLQAGSFRPPFSIENVYYGASSMETIDYPQVVKEMTTIGDITGISGSGRDIGVQLYGGFFNKRGFNTLEYRIGVFNGSGINVKNSNRSKDVSGLISVKPIRDLAIIASGYYGDWRPEAVGNEVSRDYARQRWAAGFIYDDGKFFARGEYIQGYTGGIEVGYDEETDMPVRRSFKSDGAYLTMGVWFFDKFAPLVRVEYYTRDMLARKQTTSPYYTVGFDYRPWKYLRFQVNYTLKTFCNGDPLRNQVDVMLTGLF